MRSVSAERGPPTGEQPFTSVQIGTLSIAILGIFLAFTVAIGVRAHSPPVAIFAVLTVAAAVMLATLTIRVDATGVEWYFTGRVFSKRLAFDEIESYAPRRVLPVRLGMQVGFEERHWIVSGLSVVEFHSRGMTYIVGSSDPETVCAEIARRMQSCASTST